jgi:hypothetical protein
MYGRMSTGEVEKEMATQQAYKQGCSVGDD